MLNFKPKKSRLRIKNLRIDRHMKRPLSQGVDYRFVGYTIEHFLDNFEIIVWVEIEGGLQRFSSKDGASAIIIDNGVKIKF